MIKVLAEQPLYKHVQAISDHCYNSLPDLPDDERYPMTFTIRSCAFEITDHVAQAYGSTDPRDAFWKFGLAKRSLYAIYNGFQQAYKRDYLSVNLDLMVMIETAITESETEINSSQAKIAAHAAILDGKLTSLQNERNHENKL